jgi:hypothetical protein
MTSLTHESSAADVLTGVGGATNGKEMGNSFHTYLANCTTCHMYKLRAPDSNGNPQDTIKIGDEIVPVTAEVYAKYRELVGDHSYRMATTVDIEGVPTEVQNIAACNQCHTEPVTDFDFRAVNAQDYDGNGRIDGIQTEVKGLLSILSNKFAAIGITVFDAYPFIDVGTQTNSYSWTSLTSTSTPTKAAAQAAIRRAAWNRASILRELSFGVHNTQFTIRLLQSSYTDLSTNTVSADISHTIGSPFDVDYPDAFLR